MGRDGRFNFILVAKKRPTVVLLVYSIPLVLVVLKHNQRVSQMDVMEGLLWEPIMNSWGTKPLGLSAQL
jgi:hypothetical protein